MLALLDLSQAKLTDSSGLYSIFFPLNFEDIASGKKFRCMIEANIYGSEVSGTINFHKVYFELEGLNLLAQANAHKEVARCSGLNQIYFHANLHSYTLSNDSLKVCDKKDPSKCQEFK